MCLLFLTSCGQGGAHARRLCSSFCDSHWELRGPFGREGSDSCGLGMQVWVYLQKCVLIKELWEGNPATESILWVWVCVQVRTRVVCSVCVCVVRVVGTSPGQIQLLS